ncbi:unnamed protein product [Blepharisma stoltei]|uniref:Phospholipase n=1 Tax=Blepharisma stoltei TaxID=1481888 RepID=A0AAU9JW76_9CILI|nr:unnamed protein product [Blepharisma stoltei]
MNESFLRQTRYLVTFKPHISKHSVGLFDETLVKPGAPISIYRLVFTFEVKYQHDRDHNFDWFIRRTFCEFQELHQNLLKEISRGNMLTVPLFPDGEQFLSSTPDIQLEYLENYLLALTGQIDACNNPEFWSFLEVSALSFDGASKKRKEGYVLKRTGGRISNERRCFNCSKHFKRLQKRWMIIRDNMVGYLSTHIRDTLHEVLMFKGRFEVEYGLKETGYEDGIRIITLRRDFIFRAGSILKRNEWVESIQEAYNQSEWHNEIIRYESSFPVRNNNYVKWYIDARFYFNEVYETLKRAQREVFISDWWLSPELYLKRPSKKFDYSQVCEILGALADRGVTVYVHVYKEVSLALTINSLHTKNTLQRRNPNIRVVRHPHRSAVGGEFLWTHHEKIVCIDQEIAFIGGLDLCYGRMDTNEHLLTDLQEPYFWNGIDYSNVRIADFSEVANHERDIIDRNTHPRMPWHDVALKVVGKAAADIGMHFIELWNHVMTDITGAYYKNKDLLQPNYSNNRRGGKKRSVVEMSRPISVNSSLSFLKEEAKEEPQSISESLESSCPAMQRSKSHGFPENLFQEQIRERGTLSLSGPSRRINVAELDKKIEEENNQSIDTAIHIDRTPLDSNTKKAVNNLISKGGGIIEESTDRKMSVVGDQLTVVSPLRKNTQSIVLSPITDHQRQIREKLEAEDEAKLQKELEADQEEGDEAFSKNLLHPKMKELGQTGTCECQVLRSAGLWSLGLEHTEHSIHTAYLNLIDQADHFIYIENQFFISSTAGNPVKNQISQALVERIKCAAKRKEKFKVIVVCPLLPGFEGSINDPGAAVLRVQLHWEYQTICRGINSLYEQLKSDENIYDPLEYIRFYGLRTHDMLNDTPVTEIVYVHSKLMIIDDDIVLMGSANINDRSLLGSNDSEIAMIISDQKKKQSIMNGQPKNKSCFAYTLRISLFKEILGIDDEAIIEDPLSEAFDELMWSTASSNTALYKHIFRCYPDNEILRISDIVGFESQAQMNDYVVLRENFKGFIVDFPMDFLRDEDLRISIFHKEYYIPDVNFV